MDYPISDSRSRHALHLFSSRQAPGAAADCLGHLRRSRQAVRDRAGRQADLQLEAGRRGDGRTQGRDGHPEGDGDRDVRAGLLPATLREQGRRPLSPCRIAAAGDAGRSTRARKIASWSRGDSSGSRRPARNWSRTEVTAVQGTMRSRFPRSSCEQSREVACRQIVRSASRDARKKCRRMHARRRHFHFQIWSMCVREIDASTNCGKFPTLSACVGARSRELFFSARSASSRAHRDASRVRSQAKKIDAKRPRCAVSGASDRACARRFSGCSVPRLRASKYACTASRCAPARAFMAS